MMSETVKIDPVLKTPPVYIVNHKSDGESPTPKEHFKQSKKNDLDEDTDVVDENVLEDQPNKSESLDKDEQHIDELV